MKRTMHGETFILTPGESAECTPAWVAKVGRHIIHAFRKEGQRDWRWYAFDREMNWLDGGSARTLSGAAALALQYRVSVISYAAGEIDAQDDIDVGLFGACSPDAGFRARVKSGQCLSLSHYREGYASVAAFGAKS